MDDGTQVLARRVQHPQPARTSAVYVVLHVHLHPIGDTRPLPGQVAKHPVGGQRQGAVGLHVKGANVASTAVVDVQDALVGGKGQAVGDDEIPDQQGDGPQVRRDPVNTGVVQLHPGSGRSGVGEIDAAVGLNHDVVGPVQALALVAVGDHGDATVGLAADHAGSAVASDQPALHVPGQAVGVVGRLFVHGHRPIGGPLHAPVVADVAEQQVAPLLPPQGSFSGPVVVAESGGQLVDGLALGHDAFQFGRDLLYGHKSLLGFQSSQVRR